MKIYKKPIPIILLFFYGTFLYGQNNTIDSLRKIISGSKDKVAVANALTSLGSIIYNTYPDSLIPITNQALLIINSGLKDADTARKREFLKILAEAYSNIGTAYNYKGDVSLTMHYFVKSLDVRKELNDKENMGYCYSNLGYVYNERGNISKALEYYFMSLKMHEEVGNKDGVALTLNNMARVYIDQNMLDKALENYKQCLDIWTKTGDIHGVGVILNSMGKVYQKQGDAARAMENYTKSLKIRREINDQIGISQSLQCLGDIYYNRKDHVKALEYLNESLTVLEKIDDKKGWVTSLISIAKVYIEQNNLLEAEKYGKKALKAAEELGYPESIQGSAFILNKVYRTRKDWANAYEMFDLYSQMKDSVRNEANTRNAIRTQMNFDFTKKTLADSLKNAENIQINLVKLQEEKTKRNALIGGLFLVLVFSAFLFNRFKVNIKQKKVIEEKNKEIMDSINYAKRIQNAILAREEDIEHHLKESFLLYQPKDIIAGDFYFFEVNDTHIFYAAADCTGHGVPGALMSVVCSNSLTRCVKEFGLSKPGEILDKTRELVVETLLKSGKEVKDGMDISLLSFLRKNMNEVQWAGANNPLWYMKNNTMVEIKGDKQPIGLYDKPKPFTTHPLSLSRGDILFLFTDGYADQFGGPKGKKFKYKALNELLISMDQLSLREQKKILQTKFNEWKGELEQVDDVCVIGIKI